MLNRLDMSNAVPQKVQDREGHLWLIMVLFVVLWTLPAGLFMLLFWVFVMGYSIVKVWDFLGGKRGRTKTY